MNYLALDLGTKCGVAYNFGEKKTLAIGHTHWTLQGPKGEYANIGSTSYGARFRRFTKCLDYHHKIIPIEHILYEEVHAHAGTRAAHIYGGFLAVLAEWADEHSVPMTGVGVGTVKRRITGKGNASKQAVMAACVARRYAPKTFDEADALALLLGVLEQENSDKINAHSGDDR